MSVIATTKSGKQYKLGAATKYKPEMCQIAKDFIGRGHSLRSLVAELDVGVSTLMRWREEHQEFAEALEKGESLRAKTLETMMMRTALSGEGNAAVQIFLAKNWLGMRDDYRLTGDGENGAIVIKWEK